MDRVGELERRRKEVSLVGESGRVTVGRREGVMRRLL